MSGVLDSSMAAANAKSFSRYATSLDKNAPMWLCGIAVGKVDLHKRGGLVRELILKKGD
jgi:hypothetical protein